MLSSINNQQLTGLNLVGGFNAKLSKLYPSDKDNKAGRYIDTLTTTSCDTWSTDKYYKYQVVMY